MLMFLLITNSKFILCDSEINKMDENEVLGLTMEWPHCLLIQAPSYKEFLMAITLFFIALFIVVSVSSFVLDCVSGGMFCFPVQYVPSRKQMILVNQKGKRRRLRQGCHCVDPFSWIKTKIGMRFGWFFSHQVKGYEWPCDGTVIELDLDRIEFNSPDGRVELMLNVFLIFSPASDEVLQTVSDGDVESLVKSCVTNWVINTLSNVKGINEDKEHRVIEVLNGKKAMSELNKEIIAYGFQISKCSIPIRSRSRSSSTVDEEEEEEEENEDDEDQEESEEEEEEEQTDDEEEAEKSGKEDQSVDGW